MAETHEVAAQDDSGGRVDVGADVDLRALRRALHNYCWRDELVVMDPNAVLALIARVEAAEAAVERVRDIARAVDDQMEAIGFDPLDSLTIADAADAERQGFLDGMRTIATNVSIALDGGQ